MSIKSNIRKYRKQANLSQIQLAEKLQISIATLRRWEAGKTAPNGVMIERIAKILGVNSEDIVANSKEKSKNNNMLIFDADGLHIEMPPDERSYEILISLIKERRKNDN